MSEGNWERDVLTSLLTQEIKERRRARRWSIFFKLLIFGIVFLFIALHFLQSTTSSANVTAMLAPEGHVGVIDIEGEISADVQSSADNVIEGLRLAYSNPKLRGVILRINSPGGSPVQSRLIYKEIQRLKKTHQDIQLVAFIADMGASAAYLIASGADWIYADETSLVGSIGVLISSFGFTEGMDKMGVERRLYTSGKHKGMLDPFSPRQAEDDAFVQTELDIIHQAFIQNVKEGRGARLKNHPDLFSGRFWSGQHALELGLIDGFYTVDEIAVNLFSTRHLVDYTQDADLWKRFSKRFKMWFGKTLSETLGIALLTKTATL